MRVARATRARLARANHAARAALLATFALGATACDGTLFEAITAPPSSLTLTVAPAPTTIDLSALGTRDWAAYGLATPLDVNHKNIPAPVLTAPTLVQTGATIPADRVAAAGVTSVWNDGTPTAIETGATSAIAMRVVGNGLELTIPATVDLATISLVVGGQLGAAKIEAGFDLDPDTTAGDDQSLVNMTGAWTGLVTIAYRCAVPSCNLVIEYELDQAAAPDGTNGPRVSLSAAYAY